MKKTILLLGVLLTSYSFAQVSINKDAAHTPKATLDVEAMTTTGDTVEGILIPRVTREKAAAMRNVVESTMIYVDNVTTGAASGTTADVDTKGFYYYNGTKWVKVGAGTAKTIKVINTGIKVADWANNQYALVHKTSNGIELPDPAANKYRVIAVTNLHTNSVSYILNAPASNSALFAGKGHILMSDGTNWYTIGGSY